MKTSDLAPALLAATLALPILAAAPPAPPAAPTEPTWENLAAYLDAQAEAGLTAAVLVVREGEVVLHRGYGLANREAGIPIRPDTIFATGSQPIDFTHAAILWLAQEGKLDLSAPITELFGDVPPDKRAITVEQLMTGRSGLRDFHGRPGDRDPDHAWIDREEAVRRILEGELLFAPGDGEAHSHSAWGLLAAVVEIVSGESYRDFTRERIFRPAGMADTGFNGEPVPEERLAIGYGRRSDGEVNAPPGWGKTSWLVLGSGGQISTTGDTGRFLDAMREGRILEPDWARRFFGPEIAGHRNGDVYGYEMFLYRSPMAESYAILMTNAFAPERGREDEHRFVRVSRALGDLVLADYRPKFSLGVELAPGEGGVLVEGVRPGSAAERDGLRPGDVLLAAGEEPFGDDPLAVLDPYLESGEPVRFLLRRGGEERTVVVRPEPR